MNVDQVSDDLIPKPDQKEDRLSLIFKRQRELMEKYHHIEVSNGFIKEATPIGAVDLNDRHGQARLKDFAWRFTEELCEATEAHREHKELVNHFYEELSDAYHFLTELLILSDMDEDMLYNSISGPLNELVKGCRLESLFRQCCRLHHSERYIPESFYRVVEAMGISMNCLKNKPWKQTHMLTDKSYYYECLSKTYAMFIHLCKDAGLDAEGLYTIYYKKSEVNKFRQRSNY